MTRTTPAQPRGWPAHLHPYRVTGCHPQRIADARLYPYDVRGSVIRSWVVIVRGVYRGLIENTGEVRGSPYRFAALVEGRSEKQYAARLTTAVAFF